VKREKRWVFLPLSVPGPSSRSFLSSDIAKGSDPGWAASLPLSWPLSPIGNCHPERWRAGPLSAERAATPATPQLLKHLRCIELRPHGHTRHSFENRHTNADCADCRLDLYGRLID
jgi:hypothetical protein